MYQVAKTYLRHLSKQIWTAFVRFGSPRIDVDRIKQPRNADKVTADEGRCNCGFEKCVNDYAMPIPDVA